MPETPPPQPPVQLRQGSINYDQLLLGNLVRVFSERDAVKRLAALRELYAEDGVLYEPDEIVKGRTAISDRVGALLASFPAGFTFTAIGPAVGHHGMGRLRWSAGPPGGPIAVTGTDVAVVEEGRIKALYVFIDRPAN